MKHITSSTPPSLGRALSDTELAIFSGGVTEGGCIPDPMKEVMKKLQGTSTIHNITQ